MRVTSYLPVVALAGIAVIIYYPLFFTHYFYTDEITQLWLYRKDSDFAMFIPQGRILTDHLFHSLFGAIDTIRQITWLRVFSFIGWLLCIPVWYAGLSRVTAREGLPSRLPFFAILFLITCPPFCISVGWASCMELFIANTSGFVAGFILYDQIRYKEGRTTIPVTGILAALFFGLITLSTYQNGFGCFLLPFLLQAVAIRRISRSAWIGIGGYFAVCTVYFILFRVYLHVIHLTALSRTSLATNPINKLWFFFTRPMASAFHFTWLVNELSKTGILISCLLFCGCAYIILFQKPSGATNPANREGLKGKLTYLAGIVCFLILIYLPSMIVKENYGSNRTLLALDLAVFVFAFTTLLPFFKQDSRRRVFVAGVGIFLVASAWYNFRYQFLRPVKAEYDTVRAFIEQQYQKDITHIEFIRPMGDLFQRKYGCTSSWDEFGVPSTFPDWVPEFFARQVVFEKTGSRQAGAGLTVNHWLGREAYLQEKGKAPVSGAFQNTLVVDVEELLLK